MLAKTDQIKAALKRLLIKTDAQVRAAPKGLHRVDGVTGLYLNKGAEGGSWIYRYRAGGKRPEMGLGPAGDGGVSLAQVKRIVMELAAQRIRGVDPAAARRRERAEIEAREKADARRVTFAQASEDYADRRTEE